MAVNSSTETEAKRARHSSLASAVANIKRMTLGQWKFEEHETLVKLSLHDNGHVLPKFRVTIYASLKFRISIFGWNLIASHPLYTQNEQSVKFLSVRDLNSLESFTLCCGVPKESCVGKLSKIQQDLTRHVARVRNSRGQDLFRGGQVQGLIFLKSLFLA